MSTMETADNADRGVDVELAGPDGERFVIQLKGGESSDADAAQLAKLLAAAARGLESAAASIELADVHIAASKDAVRRLRGLKFAA